MRISPLHKYSTSHRHKEKKYGNQRSQYFLGHHQLPGAVNDEIELTMPSGTKLVASITKASTERLGLVEGKEACALVKASMVILMNDADQYILSTRNQFCGTVKSVTPGAVNGEVVVDLGADGEMTSIITMGSISKLGLAEGSKVTAIVKATNVIMAVKK